MTRVSIVIPTFNEPDVAAVLDRLAPHIAPLDAEVVIVDDSDLWTHAELKQAAKRDGVRVLEGERKGKGAAVRVGMLAAEGNAMVCLDADLDDEKLLLIPEFVRLIEEEKYDVVIAERRGRWQYRNLGRFILSIGLFLAQRFFIFQSTRFFDTQCGFKAYRREPGRVLATMQTVNGGMFDIEHLYVAVKHEMRIAQVPVAPMRELRPSRLRVMRCLVHDPVDLVRVKINGVLGRYTL